MVEFSTEFALPMSRLQSMNVESGSSSSRRCQRTQVMAVILGEVNSRASFVKPWLDQVGILLPWAVDKPFG